MIIWARLRTGQPLHTTTQWVVLTRRDLKLSRSSGRANKGAGSVRSKKHVMTSTRGNGTSFVVMNPLGTYVLVFLTEPRGRATSKIADLSSGTAVERRGGLNHHVNEVILVLTSFVLLGMFVYPFYFPTIRACGFI